MRRVIDAPAKQCDTAPYSEPQHPPDARLRAALRDAAFWEHSFLRERAVNKELRSRVAELERQLDLQLTRKRIEELERQLNDVAGSVGESAASAIDGAEAPEPCLSAHVPSDGQQPPSSENAGNRSNIFDDGTEKGTPSPEVDAAADVEDEEEYSDPSPQPCNNVQTYHNLCRAPVNEVPYFAVREKRRMDYYPDRDDGRSHYTYHSFPPPHHVPTGKTREDWHYWHYWHRIKRARMQGGWPAPNDTPAKVPRPIDPQQATMAVQKVALKDKSGSKKKVGDKDGAAAAQADPEHKGITPRTSGRFQAQLFYAGKSRYIGIFDTREEAGWAYEIARDVLKSDGKKPYQHTAQSTEETEAKVKAAQMAAVEGVEKRLKGKMAAKLSS